jgi:hypothetical protein
MGRGEKLENCVCGYQVVCYLLIGIVPNFCSDYKGFEGGKSSSFGRISGLIGGDGNWFAGGGVGWAGESTDCSDGRLWGKDLSE